MGPAEERERGSQQQQKRRRSPEEAGEDILPGFQVYISKKEVVMISAHKEQTPPNPETLMY